MNRVFTLDRLPIVALLGLLIGCWIAADGYVAEALSSEATPFTPVWEVYDRQGTAILMAWAVAALLLAGLLPLRDPVSVLDVVLETKDTVQRLMPLLLIIAFSGLGLLLVVKGMYLFEAPRYLMFAVAGPPVSLANVLAPVTVITIGLVSARRPWLGRLLLAVAGVVLFAYATRLFAGIALLYVVGRLLGGAKVRWASWVVASAFALVTLPLPLLNRNQSAHGLFPYAEASWQAVMEEPYLSRVTAAAAENVGFTVPLFQFVAEKADIPWQSMVVSLSPAPGSVVGWDRVFPTLRVHDYIPYSMLGEFASYGGPALFAAVFAWGVVVRWCIQRLHQPGNPFMLLFLASGVGLSLITVFNALQYNTRAVMRIVSVMVILVVLERAVRWYLSLREELMDIPPLPVHGGFKR